MPEETATSPRAKCVSCGFEAPAGSDAWDTANHPSLGALTQCAECGSTDVHSRD